MISKYSRFTISGLWHCSSSHQNTQMGLLGLSLTSIHSSVTETVIDQTFSEQHPCLPLTSSLNTQQCVQIVLSKYGKILSHWRQSEMTVIISFQTVSFFLLSFFFFLTSERTTCLYFILVILGNSLKRQKIMKILIF